MEDNADYSNPWQIKAERIIYENPWIELREFDVINPSGGNGIYGKVGFKNMAIGILPLDENDNTWLVGQFRFPTNSYSWEIPMGGGSKADTPLASAQRELLEETGLKAASWVKVLEMHLSNSITDELSHSFVATQLTQFAPEPEETEQLIIKKLPFREAFQMVIDGKITDAVSVATILKVQYLKEHSLL